MKMLRDSLIRKQQRAHMRVFRAVKRGELIRPEKCPRCGSKNKRIEAHHEDYSKPLDVKWLCSSCHVTGELHPRAKLSKSDVLEIRELKGYVTLRELAKAYGVSKSHISNVQARRCWDHLAAENSDDEEDGDPTG